MAGHSKWANIQHRKGRQDAKRGKLWTKIIREITVAARAGGADPDANPRLRMVWDKANAANMPKDNVQRAIAKGVGGADGSNYDEIRYEGYGIGGVAVVVDCMTDNRTRTVADVRHAFAKHGGNMGQEGSVAFMFTHCGQFVFAPGTSEDVEVICPPASFAAVRSAFEKAGLTPEMADIVMKPNTETELVGDDAIKMQKLLDALESLDDVQEVYSNASMDEQG